VPSKALLAASGRVRDMKNASHLKMLGIEVGLLQLLNSVCVSRSVCEPFCV
jgi:dihydrolipoamide dehydrogenase